MYIQFTYTQIKINNNNKRFMFDIILQTRKENHYEIYQKLILNNSKFIIKNSRTYIVYII